MQNVLMRPRPDAVGLPRRSLIEVKSGLRYGLERKEFDPASAEAKALYDEFKRNFNAYRTKADGRVNELQEQLDRALIDMKRPITRGAEDKAVPKLTKEWDAYIRHGTELPSEFKALSAGSNPDGGHLVPQVLSDRIIEVARNRSNIRQIAQTIQITGGAFEIVADPDDLTANWVGEQTARPETTTPALSKLVFPAHEMYAMPKATQTILDDANVNIEEWLSQRVADKLSRTENTAFVVGDGVSKPRGFMAQNFVANASWTWGNVGYIATGDADNFIDPTTSVSPADALINLVYALKADYCANGTFVMNSNTAGVVRKFKDADGRYIWTDSIVAGQPALLLGYPVVIAEDMADVGSAAFPVAFGDFSRAYIIVDRVGVRVLRDPFTAKPFVLFYTTKRVGGGVADYDAYKVLKCETL
jgi:HK97 family phage major capsid protein